MRTTLVAPSSGWISDIDALTLGRARPVGAGRTHPDDVLDLGAGIELLATAERGSRRALAYIGVGAEAVEVPASRLLQTVGASTTGEGGQSADCGAQPTTLGLTVPAIAKSAR